MMETLSITEDLISRFGDSVEYSTNLFVFKNRYLGPTKVLSDSTVVDPGEFIGNIHLQTINSDGPSSSAMASQFSAEAVRGLCNLAYECEVNGKPLNNVVAFRGISDVVRPSFVKRLGFPDDVIELYRNQNKMKKRIGKYRGLYSENMIDSNVKDVYEIWLSKMQLIANMNYLVDLYTKF